MLEKSALEGGRLVGRAESFDGRHAVAIMHCRQRQAAVDPDAVHDHRASTALAVVTTLLRAGQADVLPQEIKETDPRVVRHGVSGSVYGNCVGQKRLLSP